MLSSADFLDLVIIERLTEAKRAFWKRRWGEWGRKFILSPFNPQRLTPFSYDLSVGAEVYSCNRQKVEQLTQDKRTYPIAPRETVVVKTQEFIALPPYYSATVWPRFKMVTEGIFQSMVKIDPTWFGELGVAITNLSPAQYPIARGEPFATLILYELKTETGMFLWREEDVPVPGEIKLDEQLKQEDLANNIAQARLDDICELRDGKLRITQLPDADSFLKLMAVHPSEEWRCAIRECLGAYPRTMDALRLTTLELIRPKHAKGKRLTREEVRSVECTLSDLEATAIDHGKPFHLLPALPEYVLKETIRRVEAQVAARLFPEIIGLTLRVLALLSLIGAVFAVTASLFGAGFSWLGVVCVVIFLGMFIVLIKTLRTGPDFSADGATRLHGGEPGSPGGAKQRPNWRLPWLYGILDKLLSKRRKR